MWPPTTSERRERWMNTRTSLSGVASVSAHGRSHVPYQRSPGRARDLSLGSRPAAASRTARPCAALSGGVVAGVLPAPGLAPVCRRLFRPGERSDRVRAAAPWTGDRRLLRALRGLGDVVARVGL